MYYHRFWIFSSLPLLLSNNCCKDILNVKLTDKMLRIAFKIFHLLFSLYMFDIFTLTSHTLQTNKSFWGCLHSSVKGWWHCLLCMQLHLTSIWWLWSPPTPTTKAALSLSPNHTCATKKKKVALASVQASSLFKEKNCFEWCKQLPVTHQFIHPVRSH